MFRAARKNWKAGCWIVTDEESGKVVYSDQVVKDWKGLYVTKKYADREHPQDFVKGLSDPRPIPFSSPFYKPGHICNYLPIFIGNTSVTARRDGPADHIFETSGIGDMSIGCSFIIYPNS